MQKELGAGLRWPVIADRDPVPSRRRGPTRRRRCRIPRARWREVRFAVLDFETTGLRPSSDEIVSFATFPIELGRVRVAGGRYRLVRPRRMPGAESIRIHGLRPADLEHAPPLEDVLDELLEAITGRAIVAHVAAVERGFLGAALARHGLELRNPIVDTAALAAELSGRRSLGGPRGALGPGAVVPAAGPPPAPRRR